MSNHLKPIPNKIEEALYHQGKCVEWAKSALTRLEGVYSDTFMMYEASMALRDTASMIPGTTIDELLAGYKYKKCKHKGDDRYKSVYTSYDKVLKGLAVLRKQVETDIVNYMNTPIIGED